MPARSDSLPRIICRATHTNLQAPIDLVQPADQFFFLPRLGWGRRCIDLPWIAIIGRATMQPKSHSHNAAFRDCLKHRQFPEWLIELYFAISTWLWKEIVCSRRLLRLRHGRTPPHRGVYPSSETTDVANVRAPSRLNITLPGGCFFFFFFTKIYCSDNCGSGNAYADMHANAHRNTGRVEYLHAESPFSFRKADASEWASVRPMLRDSAASLSA